MSSYLTGRRAFIPLIFLAIVLCVTACGKNISGSPDSNTVSNNVPLGTGMNPEPGTDGKPAPLPDGHYESMVASNVVNYVGSDNGRLYALNSRNGTVRWQYNAGAPVYVAAVVQGVVYADATTGTSAVAFAFNAASGKVLWRYNVNDYVSQLMVENGTVYIGTAATGNSIRLYALNASTGSLFWHYSAAAETPGLLSASDGVVLYAEIQGIASGNFTEQITALRGNDGSVLWRLPINPTDGYAHGTPAVSNGVVYIGTNNGSVYAVRASDGSVLWHVAHTGGFKFIPLDISPLIDNGMVFVEGKQGPIDENLSLFAMRANDGKLVWSKSLGVEPGPMVNQLQIVNGTLYTGNGLNGFVALRESDGSLLWQHTADSVYGSFMVVNGRVHINSGDGVLALRTDDGTVSWKSPITSLDAISSAGPAQVVDNGIVFVATTRGIVLALDASSGHTLWQYAIPELAVPTNPVYAAQVQFSNSVTYQQAVRLITDLGLQTFADCAFQWRPMGDQENFPTYHWLTIAATVNSAPLWFNRLQTATGVVSVQASGPHSCPHAAYDPKALVRLNDNAPLTYIQVTFSNSANYDTVLDAVNNLGFRLANPYYEQARSRGNKPAWSTAGQENTFGSTHTLLLATTDSNATIWQQQLKSAVGVTKVDTAVGTGC